MAPGIEARIRRLQEAQKRLRDRFRDIDTTALFALKRLDRLSARLEAHIAEIVNRAEQCRRHLETLETQLAEFRNSHAGRNRNRADRLPPG